LADLGHESTRLPDRESAGLPDGPVDCDLRFSGLAALRDRGHSGSYRAFSLNGTGDVLGKPSIEPRTYRLTAKAPGEWLVVTRDLLTDSGSPFSLDGAIKLETDGAVLVDAVYRGRTVRELNRGYPKPARREKE